MVRSSVADAWYEEVVRDATGLDAVKKESRGGLLLGIVGRTSIPRLTDLSRINPRIKSRIIPRIIPRIDPRINP
jgi:hypothetical protein